MLPLPVSIAAFRRFPVFVRHSTTTTFRLLSGPDFCLFYSSPIQGRAWARPQENGDDVANPQQRSEAVLRGARMLRTALGPAIAGFLEDPTIVEVMLTPDGRLWIDRLSDGLSETDERLSPADGDRKSTRLNSSHQ